MQRAGGGQKHYLDINRARRLALQAEVAAGGVAASPPPPPRAVQSTSLLMATQMGRGLLQATAEAAAGVLGRRRGRTMQQQQQQPEAAAAVTNGTGTLTARLQYGGYEVEVAAGRAAWGLQGPGPGRGWWGGVRQALMTLVLQRHSLRAHTHPPTHKP